YALAVSPDQAGKFVAIGGLGVRNGSVVVLERETGRVVHALANVETNQEVNREGTWALAFSPSGQQLAIGKEDGSIWLWNLQSNRKDDVRKLGSHSNPKQLTANRVRLVAFLDEKRVVSVARDATVMRWDLRPGGKPGLLFRFDLPAVFQAAFSPE